MIRSDSSSEPPSGGVPSARSRRSASGAGLRALAAAGALAAVTLATASPASAQGQEQDRARRDTTATLTGRVVSAMTGGPLPDARVVLKGAGLGAFTDSTGQFRIPNVPPGSDTVQVSMVGFAEEQLPIDLRPAATTTVTLLLSETVLRMEEISVTVERERSGKLAGFERRRKRGFGHFLTPEEIEEKNVQHTSDLLRGVPGIRVGAYRLGRTPVQVVRRGEPCEPRYWVDGVSKSSFNIDDLNRDDVMAMEIYRGPAETPARFGASAGCGIIVIWTQEGGVDRGG